jgi:hypothetical protein
MFWVIVAMLVVAYLGNGVFVSRFLMKPWIAKEFGGYEILTACMIGLFWPIALAIDCLSAGAYLLGRMFGGEKDDDDTNGTRVE